MHNKIKLSIGCVLAIGSLAAPASALADAQAAPDPSQVVAALSDATNSQAVTQAPASATVTQDPSAGDALVTDAPGSDVTDPDTSAGSVVLNAADGDPNRAIKIGLPGASSTEQTAGADLAVYQGTSQDSSTAVQPEISGADIYTVLADANAPTSYSFPLAIPSGGTITSDGNGGYVISDALGTQLATISTPWATDATGMPLPTKYTLDGTTLTQTIDTTGATYPVTADPSASVPNPNQNITFCTHGAEIFRDGSLSMGGFGIVHDCTGPAKVLGGTTTLWEKDSAGQYLKLTTKNAPGGPAPYTSPSAFAHCTLALSVHTEWKYSISAKGGVGSYVINSSPLTCKV